MLHEFEFRLDQKDDVKLYEKICEARPRLKVLKISPAFSLPGLERVTDETLDFRNTLEKLLHTIYQSLETISVVGAYHLAHLSFPPLVNLSKCTVDSADT